MFDTKHVLVEALSEALGKMAFLAIVPMDEEAKTPRDAFLSEIHFTGPKAGTIQILAGSDLVQLLAENISAGQDTDHAACLDVFREFSNVTCGLLLPALSGSTQDIFDVTVPTVVENKEAPTWDDFTADTNCHVLNVENNQIAVKLIYP